MDFPVHPNIQPIGAAQILAQEPFKIFYELRNPASSIRIKRVVILACVTDENIVVKAGDESHSCLEISSRKDIKVLAAGAATPELPSGSIGCYQAGD
jgi:hypothetical protein